MNQEERTAINARAATIAAEIGNGGPIEAIRKIVLSTDRAALGEFLIELDRLLAIKIPDNGEAPKLERKRHVMVLKAIAVFVRRTWLEQGAIKLSSHLFRWALAIEQVNDGTVHPMLDAAKRRRGPKDDEAEKWRGRMLLCIALHCYENDGRSRKRTAIASTLAGKYPVLKKLMRNDGDKLSSAIISWHRAFQQGTANKIAQFEWKHGLGLVDGWAAGSPAAYAEWAKGMLASAIDSAGAVISRRAA